MAVNEPSSSAELLVNYSKAKQGHSASTWGIHRVELHWSRRAPGKFVPQVDVTCLSRSGKLIHMHGSSVKYENRITCTFTLRLTAKIHKSYPSSDYSSGNTGICTQVKAAVTQDLIQSLLSQCKDSHWLQWSLETSHGFQTMYIADSCHHSRG